MKHGFAFLTIKKDMFILYEDILVTECMILNITGLNVRAYGVL